jgi:hypothetical protein
MVWMEECLVQKIWLMPGQVGSKAPSERSVHRCAVHAPFIVTLSNSFFKPTKWTVIPDSI